MFIAYNPALIVNEECGKKHLCFVDLSSFHGFASQSSSPDFRKLYSCICIPVIWSVVSQVIEGAHLFECSIIHNFSSSKWIYSLDGNYLVLNSEILELYVSLFYRVYVYHTEDRSVSAIMTDISNTETSLLNTCTLRTRCQFFLFTEI